MNPRLIQVRGNLSVCILAYNLPGSPYYIGTFQMYHYIASVHQADFYKLVEVKRLELPTSCSQSRRATNCATPRIKQFKPQTVVIINDPGFICNASKKCQPFLYLQFTIKRLRNSQRISL